MLRLRLEVADIFRRYGETWRTANAGHVTLAQRRVMTAIESCRTAALDGLMWSVVRNAHVRIAYNSLPQSALPQMPVASRTGVTHFGVNWDGIRLMCGQQAAGQEPTLKYH